MANFIEQCNKYFKSSDPYKIFKISKNADSKEIKRAFYKLAIVYHPDKIDDSLKTTESTAKFQTLSKLYNLLINDESRKHFDEYGQWEEEFLSDNIDWLTYWRNIFKKISFKDIDEFEKKYKGSEKEMEEVIKYYKIFKGSMDDIIDSVMCATLDDEERFRNIIEAEVKNNQLVKYKAFTKDVISTKKRKRKAEKEAKEAEDLVKEIGLNIDADIDLKMAIQKKQKDRENESAKFLESLENKYVKKPKSKTQICKPVKMNKKKKT